MINIQENVSLAKYTTFRIGGPARYFTEVKNTDELKEALQFAKGNKVEFFVLGGGSNLLVADKGFSGLVIRVRISDLKIDIGKQKIEAGAGVALAKVIKEAAENNLSGLEWAAGIPGTIGGAVRGNAGAFGGEIGEAVERVDFFNAENMQMEKLSGAECGFEYRRSFFKEKGNLIILSIVLKMEKGGVGQSRAKMAEIIQKRLAVQPQGSSAGSFFVNPVVKSSDLISEFEKEKGVKSKAGKVPAPWLIERAGLRGKKIGGAMVSDKHANYILNTGSATAEDVIILSSFIKQQVRDQFGVELQEEVQYLGF